MVIRRGERDGRKLLLLGLSRANIDKLVEGKPISISRKTHGEAMAEDEEVAIVFGEDDLAPMV